MTKKYIYIFVILIIVLLGVLAFMVSKKLFIPAKTHYHAGFAVFQNNKRIDFSNDKYMYIEPCAANENNKKDDSQTIQIEKAHLHDNVGDLVHIERTGAIWMDLFININYPIDYSNSIGYINGKQFANFQSQPIKPYDSLVVFIGNNNPDLLSQAVTKDYMIKMAKKSTSCGD